MKLYQAMVVVLIAGNCTLAMAEKQTASHPLPVAAVTYQDSSGVSIEWDADGVNWSKIRSVGEADVMFGDRKDVWDATRKATLQAKADIAKFLKERITSSEIINEITKTQSERSANNDVNATRKTVETFVNNISSSADEILKGVIVLEQNVDMDKKFVRVTVGMSRESMRAADSLRDNINKDLNSSSKPGAPLLGSNASQPTSEIRRSKNHDNF